MIRSMPYLLVILSLTGNPLPAAADILCVKARLKQNGSIGFRTRSVASLPCPRGFKSLIDSSAMAGPTGASGEKGDTGAQGPTGPAGPQGTGLDSFVGAARVGSGILVSSVKGASTTSITSSALGVGIYNVVFEGTFPSLSDDPGDAGNAAKVMAFGTSLAPAFTFVEAAVASASSSRIEINFIVEQVASLTYIDSEVAIQAFVQPP